MILSRLRRWSLRTTVTAMTITTALTAILVAAALIHITTVRRRNAAVLYAAVQSLHVVEGMEVNLLTHARAMDGATRSETAGDLRRGLRRAEGTVSSQEEAEALAAARQSLRSYLADPSHPGALETAFADLERLVDANLVDAEHASLAAAGWDATANKVAVVLGLMIAGSSFLLVLWIRRATLRPVESIKRTLDLLSRGERNERIRVDGPAELRAIGEHLNRMADALDLQRSHQLTFIASVAHDLRTPLATLNMSLVLAEEGVPADSARRLAIARRQIAGMTRLLEDLMDTAQIESGHLELRRTVLDFGDVVRETVALFEGTSDEHEIVENIEGDVMTFGDELRLRQIVTNLLSNAIKYSPDGGTIVVSVRKEGNYAVVKVEDEGVGMSPSDLAGVFEPFRRNRSTQLLAPGSGLGLAVTKELVEAHGGEIRVSRREPKGTAFEIRLPAPGSAPTHPSAPH